VSVRKTDPVCFHLNSAAVGDLVAAGPVLRRAIQGPYAQGDYMVAVYPEFRCLFPFIQKDRMIHPDVMHHLQSFAVRRLNMTLNSQKNVCRLTPSKMPLIQYASVGLLGELTPDDQCYYAPLEEQDVSRFNIDFSRAVVVIVTYRDKMRSIDGENLQKISQGIKDMGLEPVFVGKTGKISIWKNHPAKTDFIYPGYGVDLIDKTTIPEMATIMSKSIAVIGMDSGPIHVAFTTDTPVISGFTTVRSDLRIPKARKGKSIPIETKIECRFCQSNWNRDFWNFVSCPRELSIPDCSQDMKAEYFLSALKTVVET
jgi:Glycosyltransferase family 9 (heptosyltransferase)